MLAGTDLSAAYGYDTVENSQSPSQSQSQSQKLQKKTDEPVREKSLGNSMDPNFLTSDQKLHMLSQELFKQKEHFEQNKNNGYVDKLLSKKKDLIKLVTISFVILFAISLHYLVDFYLKKYFEENILGAGKEFLLRALYPAAVVFLLWNIKAFYR